MTQHTPEPWVVHGTDIFTELGATNSNGDKAPYNDGWHIADCDVALPFDDAMFTPKEVLANARRIVACVNACADYSLEELELGLPRLLRSMNLEKIAAEQQRDELQRKCDELSKELDDKKEFHFECLQMAYAAKFLVDGLVEAGVINSDGSLTKARGSYE